MKSRIRNDRAKLLRAMRKHMPDIAKVVHRDERKHFLSLSVDCPGQISYAQNVSHKYDANKRTRTTLGRYLSRRLNIAAVSYNSVKLLLGECFGKYDSNIKVSNAVVDAYDNVRCDSCMKDNPNNCLSWYEKNGVEIAVYGDYEARAILWTLSDGRKFLDRIYPDNQGSHVEIMWQWADSRGYLHRRVQGADNEDLAPSDAYVNLPDPTGPAPYMDTFRFLSADKRLFPKYNTYRIKLDSTDGDEVLIEGDCVTLKERPECELCGDDLGDDYHEVNHNVICDNCYCNDAFCCDRCETNYYNDFHCGEIESEMVCNDCADEANQCDRCGSRQWDSLQEIDSEEVCEDCAENANCCENCERDTFQDLTKIDNKEVCEECSDEAEECEECNALTLETFFGKCHECSETEETVSTA